MRTIRELMDLSGHQALVTGGTGYIGYVIAETLAELGCNIILLDLPDSEFDRAQQLLTQRWDINVSHIACDLESQDNRKHALERLRREYGPLHILINNAAFVGDIDMPGWAVSFSEQRVETWRRALEVNLAAVFELCQGCVDLMPKNSSSSIINISSIYGLVAPDFRLYDGTNMGNPAAYAASKGGIIQLTKWLATALAPHIRVNAISPGGIYRNQSEQFVKEYNKRTPMQRMASEEDFKGVVAFLATNLSSYCTGQNLVIDGGWTIW